MNEKIDLENMSKKLDVLSTSFLEVFSLWDKVCLEEKKFITHFDLEKIEQNTVIKNKIALDLESLSKDLSLILSQVCQFHQINLPKVTIAEVSKVLEDKGQFSKENSSLVSMKNCLAGLHEQFNSYYSSLKSNSILIHKLLESHKRSVGFWQDYSTKLAASYDQNGEKKIHNRTSSKLSVKA